MEFVQYLHSVLNRGLYALRQAQRWTRPGYREVAEDKHGLIPAEKPHLLARERELLARYEMDAFRQQSSRFRYAEAMTYLDYLDRMLDGQVLPGTRPLRWLDVGAKNWTYVDALLGLIREETDNFQLTGVELDAFRRYRDGHSRIDYARSFIAGEPRARYVAGDVMALEGEFDVVSVFLPFVFPEPSLAWGLPLGHFQPEAFLAKLSQLLAPGGVLIIVNQDQVECDEQERLLAAHDELDCHRMGRMPESFLAYQYPRYGWVCRKSG